MAAWARIVVLTGVGAALLLGLPLVGQGAARSSQAAPAVNAGLYGIVDQSVYGDDGSLARFNTKTLRPLPGRTALDGYQQAWSFSPSGRELVLGNNNQSCVGGATGLRFLAVPGMQPQGEVRLTADGPVDTTVWLDATHVLAIVSVSDCLTTKRTIAYVVDADTRQIVAKTLLAGELLNSTLANGRDVLLLAPSHGFGPARVATIDRNGLLRQVVLGRLPAGRVLPTPTSGTSMTRLNIPGLAVDPATATAYVVSAGERVATVNLRTLRFGYHDLSKKQSIFARFLHWLDPTAAAKGDEGPLRQAVWLGNGMLALTGIDSTMSQSSNGTWSMAVTPAGLQLIDTHTWTYRTINANISQIERIGDLLFATGRSAHANQSGSVTTNEGLTAYTLSGQQRYQLFGSDEVDEIATINGRGYAAVATGPRGAERTATFTLSSGRIGRVFATSLYQLLVGNPNALLEGVRFSV